ncbi:MAG: hypothetical protein ACLVMF_09425 [Christensenellales bacterium]
MNATYKEKGESLGFPPFIILIPSFWREGMVNGFPAFLNQLASWVFEKRPVSFLLNEAFKEETCLSLFKESHLLLGFLHKLFMFNQRGGNSCGCSSQGHPDAHNPSSSAFAREPFRWVPLRLTGGKASRRPPPIPPQPMGGAKPLENPPKR